MDEVAVNRIAQEGMGLDDPARIFGQTVESEAVKRKREEVELTELEGRLKEAPCQARESSLEVEKHSRGMCAAHQSRCHHIRLKN